MRALHNVETWRKDWNAILGDLLHVSDRPALIEPLLAGLRSVSGFQQSVIFGYPPERRPVFLHNGLLGARQQNAISEYLRGSYLVDPFYEACRNAIADGVWRMADLAPDDFYNSVGAHPGYISPCVSDKPGVLSEEIGFFASLTDGTRVVLSLMRDAEEPPFSELEMSRLREIEPMVRHVLVRAFENDQGAQTGTAGDTSEPQRLEDVIETVGSVLSPRERDVARLLLLGYSSLAISDRLGVAVSTVKIHRRNLYAKLGISSQSEFFAIFLRMAYAGEADLA